MNRWFVVILIALAVIVLVSPGIVGRLAEESVEENLEFASGEDQDIVVTTESFRRGWFTSAGRHRVELREGLLGGLIEGALVIDTHMDHGLIPLTSLGRDSGTLRPGLASTVSTLRLDTGEDALVELPGKIYSTVGLTGEIASRYVLEPGSRSFDGGEASWQGAEVTVVTNPDTGAVSARGSVSALTVQYRDDDEQAGSMRFDSLTFDGDRLKSLHGIDTGSVAFDIDGLSIQDGAGPTIGFDMLKLVADTELEGDRLNGRSEFSLSGFSPPELEDLAIAMAIVVNGADAASLQRISAALRYPSGAADAVASLAENYSRIEPDIQTLLQAGLEVRMDRLEVSLPDGVLSSKFRFKLLPLGRTTDFSWPALLLALEASADVRFPVALFETAQVGIPDITMLVATGVLKLNGDHYEMRAEYAQGLLTVNGAPLPIPLAL